jgi:hypothetical protein
MVLLAGESLSVELGIAAGEVDRVRIRGRRFAGERGEEAELGALARQPVSQWV